MNIELLSDRILVEQEKAESKTPGGIVLPDVAKKRLHRGKVLAVGPGRMESATRTPMTVKKEQTIYYSPYSGNEIEIDRQQYVILTEGDVLAIVKD
jgi:chaperonin GroES